MNGVRLGLYGPLQKHLNHYEPGTTAFWAANVATGAVVGGLGAAVGSPVFLVKVRLQAQASSAALQVGLAQHHYRGVWHGLSTVWNTEGVRGLFRGVSGAVPRVMVGSATQLSTYDSVKQALVQHAQLDGSATSTHILASSFSGAMVVTTMNPFDVVSTRLYNQGGADAAAATTSGSTVVRRDVYSGVLDCAIKTVRAEGVRGLYKGSTAQFCRIAPHTVISFVVWERLKIFAFE
jgi:solute carrier family 25 protein 34/35